MFHPFGVAVLMAVLMMMFSMRNSYQNVVAQYACFVLLVLALVFQFFALIVWYALKFGGGS